MKELAKKLIYGLLDRVFPYYRYHHIHPNEYAKDQLIDRFFGLLREINFEPKHIIDIGANHGTWTRAVMKIFPQAHYSLFEPQHWLSEHFQDLLNLPNISFYPYGVGAKNQTAQFTINSRDDSSSFSFTPEEAIAKGFEQKSIEVIQLNKFEPLKKYSEPDIIKIDAEGWDLEVVRGASEFIKKAEVVLIEAAVLNNLFENDVLRVVKIMDEYGHRLADITDLNRPYKFKMLWLTELAFIKKNGYIEKDFYQQ